jgi:hypothetical protein
LAGKSPLSAVLTRQNLDTTREHASLSIGFSAVTRADGSTHPHTAAPPAVPTIIQMHPFKEYE